MSPSIRPKIVIARAIFPDVLAQLEADFEVVSNQADEPWTEPQLIAHLQGHTPQGTAPAQGLLSNVTVPVTATVLTACPSLRIVANMAVGTNNIDVACADKLGICVTNTPNVLTESTADFGMALLLATARRVTESEHFLRSGQWTTWRYDFFAGQEVHGSTLGILGMGRIGQAIAKRAHHGFRMRIVYHNRTPLPDAVAAPLAAQWVDLPSLLQLADHLMIVLPYSAATHHVIGAAQLARMKPTATLVNIARGGVVDDAALAQALKDQQIAAAGLDVFEGEPRVHPDLLAVPNVVLTPHIASSTVGTRRAMAQLAADNLRAVLRQGEAPLTPLNSWRPDRSRVDLSAASSHQAI